MTLVFGNGKRLKRRRTVTTAEFSVRPGGAVKLAPPVTRPTPAPAPAPVAAEPMTAEQVITNIDLITIRAIYTAQDNIHSALVYLANEPLPDWFWVAAFVVPHLLTWLFLVLFFGSPF